MTSSFTQVHNMSAYTPSSQLRFERLEARDVPSRTLFVDDDRAQIPSAAFTGIQAAVDAARRNDTIVVAPGVYREEVYIPEDKDGITLKSRNAWQAIIEAPAAAVTGAVVSVGGADKVTIRGFTITGPAQVPNSLSSGVVVFDGGSVVIENNLITRIRNNPLDGIQDGNGVLVYGDGRRTFATLEGNTITDYQKTGVLVFGPSAEARITGNDIRGAGPTGVIAQNGVEVSAGASASIRDNSITGNVYTGTGTFGAGVLVSAADCVDISGNQITGNGYGVAVFDTAGIKISCNQVDNNTGNGIVLNGVRHGVLLNNRVEENGVDGVLLFDTTRVLVTSNIVRGNGGDGLVLTGESSDNLIFFNVLRGNAGVDAFDDTTGCGTAGTGNHWFLNSIGDTNGPRLR